MAFRRVQPWLLCLVSGYLLFYGVLFAETACTLPGFQRAGPDGSAELFRAEWFHSCLGLEPLRRLAETIFGQLPRLGLVLFLVATGLLALGYLGVLRGVRAQPERWPVRRLLGWSAVAALPLALLLPPTSDDYVAYLFAGRVLSVYHLSPWHHTLAEFPAEQVYLSPAAWGPHLKCIYGPVWVAVMAAITGFGQWIAPGEMTQATLWLNVLMLRAVNAGALLAAGLAVWKIQGVLWPGQQRLVTAAFLFNPLVVYEAVGALHNDLVGVAFLLWACYLFLKNDARFVLPLALSILTKCIVLAVVPFVGLYLWRQRAWRQLGWLAGTMLVTVLLAQLTSADYLTSRLLGTDRIQFSPSSLPQFVLSLFVLAGDTARMGAILLAAGKLLTALFVPFYLLLVWRTRRREEVIGHSMTALTLLFACAYIQTMQWYYVWPLGLLCATRWTRGSANAAWASCAVLLGYFMLFESHAFTTGWNPAMNVASFTLAAIVPATIWLAGRLGWWTVCPPAERAPYPGIAPVGGTPVDGDEAVARLGAED